MRKRILASALTLVAPLAVVALQAQSSMAVPVRDASQVVCIWRPVQQAQYSFAEGRTRVSVKIWNQYCWNDGDWDPHEGWVNLTRAVLVANHKGTHEACGWTDFFEGTTWHGYFYQPYTGRNWDTGNIHLGCSPDTVTVRFVDLHSAPRFSYRGGVRPQWRWNVTENRTANPDLHATMKGTFPHP